MSRSRRQVRWASPARAIVVRRLVRVDPRRRVDLLVLDADVMSCSAVAEEVVERIIMPSSIVASGRRRTGPRRDRAVDRDELVVRVRVGDRRKCRGQHARVRSASSGATPVARAASWTASTRPAMSVDVGRRCSSTRCEMRHCLDYLTCYTIVARMRFASSFSYGGCESTRTASLVRSGRDGSDRCHRSRRTDSTA